MLRVTSIGAMFALAGCSGGLGNLSLPSLPSFPAFFEKQQDAPVISPKLALLGGDFVAVGPDRYCADTAASNPSKGFAIFVACKTLGVEDAEPAMAGIVTIQVGDAGSAIVADNLAAFAAVLSGDAGAAILARGGDADTIDIQSVEHKADRVSVHFKDEADAHIVGAQHAEWRNFVDVAGRLVTITVRGFDSAPLGEAVGAGLLAQATDAVLVANADTSATDG